MRPLLTILTAVTIATTSIMLWGVFWLQVLGAALFSVTVVVALGAFVYFAINDPDRLKT